MESISSEVIQPQESAEAQARHFLASDRSIHGPHYRRPRPGPGGDRYSPAAGGGNPDGPSVPTVRASGGDRVTPTRIRWSWAPSPVPNPFYTSSRITYQTEGAPGTAVLLTVHDLFGRGVHTLVRGPLACGTHDVSWIGIDEAGQPVSAGVYFLRLQVEGNVTSRPLLLIS
jgi:hypothetical protein